jgi:putative sugar O-methyltransferase
MVKELYEDALILENYLKKENIPLNFLNMPLLKNSMFVTKGGIWQQLQLNLLNKKIKSSLLKTYLKESIIGFPKITNFHFLTSHNSIHHLYHLALFCEKCKFVFNRRIEILEFGGGYGNMAKIIKRMSPLSTYAIIDIPQFTTLQYIYLSSVFNEDSVNLVDESQNIEKGKFNLLTYKRNLVNLFNKREIDLLIATWSLSESPKSIQNYFKRMNYFNAKYLLFAYQKNNQMFKFAENISILPNSYKLIYNSETKYIKDNYYLFARRK